MSLRDLLLGQLTYLYRATIAQWANVYFALRFGFFPFVIFLDWVTRYRHVKWTRALAKSLGSSTAIYLLNSIFVPVLMISVDRFKALWVSWNVPHLPESAWQGVPGWLVTIVAVVAMDFANYWVHRLIHRPWLWPIHAIHHSDPDVNPFTALRIHAFEALIMSASYIVLLSWLGFPAGALGFGKVFMLLHVQYVHLNVDWTHGPLKLVIASPRFHRWHHADVEAAHGKNLAGVLPIWDLLFGTYYEPGACKARVGAEGVPENDVVRLMFFPLTAWSRMIRDAVRGRPVVEKPQGIDVDEPDAAEGPDDLR